MQCVLYGPAEHGSNHPVQIIINLDTGDVLANITQAGGNDEVWFDPGTQHYYLAARGTVDSGPVR